MVVSALSATLPQIALMKAWPSFMDPDHFSTKPKPQQSRPDSRSRLRSADADCKNHVRHPKEIGSDVQHYRKLFLDLPFRQRKQRYDVTALLDTFPERAPTLDRMHGPRL